MVLRSSSYSTLAPQQQQGKYCCCSIARRDMFVVSICALLFTFFLISRQFEASLKHGTRNSDFIPPTGLPGEQLIEHVIHDDKRDLSFAAQQKPKGRLSDPSAAEHIAINGRKGGEMTNCKEANVGMVMRTNDLRVVGSSTDPAFVVAVFDTKRDNTISRFILEYGAWDPAVQSTLQFVIGETDGCLDPGTHERRLVIDVGANVGYFGLQAAAMGCEVHFYEPQLATQAAILSGICLNGVGSHAMLHEGAVTPLSKITFPIGGMKRGKDGGNIGHVRAENCNESEGEDDENARSKAVRCTTVKGYQLDKMHSNLFLNSSATAGGDGGGGGGASRILPPIILMKIDVEGSEPYVIETAWKLIRANLVSNIVLEFTPSKATFDLYVQTLRQLRDAGYFLAELPYMHMTGTDETVAGHEIAIAVPLTDIQLFSERIATYGDWRGKMFTDVWATTEKGAYERFNDKKMRVEPVFA